MEVHGRKEKKELKDHIEITNTTSNSFDRGAVDRFSIEVKDVGEPYKLRVGHDNAGMGPGWYLDKVLCDNCGCCFLLLLWLLLMQ